MHALRRYRERHDNMSLDALAKKAETTKASLSRIERGEQNVSLALIRRLVEATGGEVTANDIVGGRSSEAAE